MLSLISIHFNLNMNLVLSSDPLASFSSYSCLKIYIGGTDLTARIVVYLVSLHKIRSEQVFRVSLWILGEYSQSEELCM